MLVGQTTKYEVPDNCDGCPRLDSAMYQGDDCCRCPVLNCRLTPYLDGTLFRLVEPEDYREDWAEIYHKWFKKQGLIK